MKELARIYDACLSYFYQWWEYRISFGSVGLAWPYGSFSVAVCLKK